MYAQNNEDDHYHKYIDINKDNGCYLDIGAGNPIEISNTQFLYEKGWSGLCVEPNVDYYESWRNNRPRDILVRNPIMDVERDVIMANTFVEGTYIYEEHKNEGYKLSNHTAITLKHLLEMYPAFMEPDLFTLDVELTEDKVLATADFNIFKPKLIIIEKCIRGVSNKPRWEHLLLPNYDAVQEFPGNTFYLRKS